MKNSVNIKLNGVAKWLLTGKPSKQRGNPVPKSSGIYMLKNITNGNSYKDAAKSVSLHPTGILCVCKGRQKTSGGFKWQYLNDCGVETIPEGSRLEMSTSPSAEHPQG